MYEVGQQGRLEGPYDLMEAAAEMVAGLGAAAAGTGTGGHSGVNDRDQRGASIEDSRLIEERLSDLGLPKQKYSHFVYVCRKSQT